MAKHLETREPAADRQVQNGEWIVNGFVETSQIDQRLPIQKQ